MEGPREIGSEPGPRGISAAAIDRFIQHTRHETARRRQLLPAVAIGWTSAADLLFTLRPVGRLGVAGREQGQPVENRPMPIPAPAE